jgi:hypothetical protein
MRFLTHAAFAETGTAAVRHRCLQKHQIEIKEVAMAVHYTEGDMHGTTEVDPTTQRRVVTTTQARQGVTGHNVRYMLGFGLAAVVVIFAGLWLYYFA